MAPNLRLCAAWLAAAACTGTGATAPGPDPTGTPPDPDPTSPEPTSPEPTSPDPDPLATWTFVVWMAGDNDLESLVVHDLDELERGLAALTGDARVDVLVQADRIPGYDDSDGDWVGTRRYAIEPDAADGPISPVLEDLGEVDMGDHEALADFLLWAHGQAPAERMGLILWNHGGGFWIASDDTSGTRIQLDQGELGAALAPLAAERGRPLDLVAFDACNMAQWETAHTLSPDVDVMVASQAWVDWGGFAYDVALPEIAALGADADAIVAGEALARSAIEINDELTQAVVDLRRVDALSAAVDDLAAAWLAEPALLSDFVRARDEATGLDRQWDEFWMDLGGLADAAAASTDPDVALAGAAVRAALDEAVVGSWAAEPVSFASGLTVFTDTDHRGWIERYDQGPWAVDTRWDELVAAVTAAGM